MKILIAEDDEAINNLLVRYLKKQKYEIISFFEGNGAADYIEGHPVDLALLDIMLPNINGEELLNFFSQEGIPVIFLTAKVQLKDKVRGLSLGAEDYITKPFELEELLARIQVVQRRLVKPLKKQVNWKNIQIEESSKKVLLNSKLISLRPKEIQLMLFLIQNEGIVLTRPKIYQEIWGKNDVCDTRTLDLHIQRIRKKLHLENSLRTIYGVGYLLEDNS
ncbi:response regulator transcription factor [Lactococcus lactis]|uniref:response regulator transcription factor n=1 Tax=Lactococcus lactis TaxID=1358 RepID=UPI001D18F879|nr:response regulator transcription factor [Lactococcus lactis]MCC4121467.1 response regulator transcription factor [Lactococcus lactis]